MNIKLPEISELTDQQNEILNETEAIAIYGGAGTGKTVLSVWKHILNWEERDIKSFLITYTHSLTKYFESSIKHKSLKASQHIENKDRFNNNSNIDMLIIDEAQDIDEVQHLSFKEIYNQVSYGADDKQILYPETRTTQKRLNSIYQTKEFYLSQNFRNSYEILLFVKNLFPKSDISEEMIKHSKENFKTDEKPILAYSKNKQELDSYLIELLNIFENSKRIAILVPTVKMFDDYKILLDDNKIKYSDYNNQQNGNIRYTDVKNIHLTIFKSSKGLEFDVVIIPEIDNFNYWLRKGENSIINGNDYYVGMTRAREQLFLLSDNKNIFQKINSNLYEIENI